MRVADVMTSPALSCRADETLAAAARVMWERDCGCVPIVDEHNQVIGMLTDRDVCMGAFLTGQPPQALLISRSMSQRVIACGPEDSLARAECLMREHRVRRLPVVGMQGRLLGIVTLNDLARVTAENGQRDPGANAQSIEATLAAIGKRPA